MLELVLMLAALTALLWGLRAVLLHVRYDQAAKVVEYWRKNGIS